MDPNPNVIYEWIKQFSKGDIIALFLMGTAMFLYHKYVTRKLMNWRDKTPPLESIMTKEEHSLVCKNTMLEIKNLLMENRIIASKETHDLKELLMVTMRADILEAIKNRKP